MFELKIAAPDGALLIADADKALELVGAIVIDGPEMKTAAGEELRAMSTRSAALEKQRKELKEPALEMGRRIDALFKPAQERLDRAMTTLKTSILTYDRTEDKKREDAQRAADEVARRERERLQREAEARERAAREQRELEDAATREREADARRAIESLRKQAEEADDAAEALRLADEAAEHERRAQEDAERARQDAADRESRAHEDAQAQRQVANVISAPVVASEAPKVAGLSTRQKWNVEVVDVVALCRAVADGKVPAGYVIANEKTLRQMAVALKSEFKVPGVRAYPEDVLSARAA